MIKTFMVEVQTNESNEVCFLETKKLMIRKFINSAKYDSKINRMLHQHERDYLIKILSKETNELAKKHDTFEELMKVLVARVFSRHLYPKYQTEVSVQGEGANISVAYSVTEYPDLYNGLKNEIEENLNNDEDYEGNYTITKHIIKELYDKDFPKFYENTMADDFSNLVEKVKSDYLCDCSEDKEVSKLFNKEEI